MNDISVSGEKDCQVTCTNRVIEENESEVIRATSGKSVEANLESQMSMIMKRKRVSTRWLQANKSTSWFALTTQHFKNYKSCSSEKVHDIELKFML